MTASTVKIDLRPMGKLSRMIRKGSPEMARILKRAALRYMTAMQRRFDRLSKGGAVNGETWEPLAESTKDQRRGPRRGHKGARKFSILTDTATLKRSLLYGSPGNLIQTTGNGIKAGIGGGASHPDVPMTIGALAAIHHEGNPERGLPARPVLTVNLDEQTKRGIASDAMAEVRSIIARVAHA